MVVAMAWVVNCRSDSDPQPSDGDQDGNSEPECTQDSACPADKICVQQQCVAGCSEVHPCQDTTKECCNGTCVDLLTTLAHCRDCATSCSEHEGCTVAGCTPLTIAGLCSAPHNDAITAIVVGDAPDEPAGAVGDTPYGESIAAAFIAHCSGTIVDPAQVVHQDGGSTYVGQGPPPDENPPKGKPLKGPGFLYVVAGGSYLQWMVAYLNTEQLTPVDLSLDGTSFYFTPRETGSAVACSPVEGSQDCFVVQVGYEPAVAAVVLMVYGVYEPGTAAGAWYFEHELLPDADLRGKRWLIVGWDDGDGNQQPDPGEFTVHASSP